MYNIDYQQRNDLLDYNATRILRVESFHNDEFFIEQLIISANEIAQQQLQALQTQEISIINIQKDIEQTSIDVQEAQNELQSAKKINDNNIIMMTLGVIGAGIGGFFGLGVGVVIGGSVGLITGIVIDKFPSS